MKAVVWGYHQYKAVWGMHKLATTPCSAAVFPITAFCSGVYLPYWPLFFAVVWINSGANFWVGRWNRCWWATSRYFPSSWSTEITLILKKHKRLIGARLVAGGRGIYSVVCYSTTNFYPPTHEKYLLYGMSVPLFMFWLITDNADFNTIILFWHQKLFKLQVKALNHRFLCS